VATASAAIAAAHGYPDGERIPVELMLATIGRIATAVDLPTTADLESGYGDVDSTIRRAVQLGVAGANLEDALRPLPSAVRMVEQALRAAAAEGVPLVLNARTDRYLQPQGRPPAALLNETLQRGQAFLDAGADCVFAPGCTDPDAISTPPTVSARDDSACSPSPVCPLPGNWYGSVSPGCPTARHRTGTPSPPSPTWQPASKPLRPSTTRHRLPWQSPASSDPLARPAVTHDDGERDAGWGVRGSARRASTRSGLSRMTLWVVSQAWTVNCTSARVRAVIAAIGGLSGQPVAST